MTEAFEGLAARLANRYALERELGAGEGAVRWFGGRPVGGQRA